MTLALWVICRVHDEGIGIVVIGEEVGFYTSICEGGGITLVSGGKCPTEASPAMKQYCRCSHLLQGRHALTLVDLPSIMKARSWHCIWDD